MFPEINKLSFIQLLLWNCEKIGKIRYTEKGWWLQQNDSLTLRKYICCTEKKCRQTL